jgi:hypothetical protein
MYRFVASAVVVLFSVSIALSEEFFGRITKFEDGKITFVEGFGFKKADQKNEEQTFVVDAKCKFRKGKLNKKDRKLEADGELEGGKEAFEKRMKELAASEDQKNLAKAVFAQIITEGKGDKAKVMEIRVVPVFGGAKKDAN